MGAKGSNKRFSRVARHPSRSVSFSREHHSGILASFAVCTLVGLLNGCLDTCRVRCTPAGVRILASYLHYKQVVHTFNMLWSPLGNLLPSMLALLQVVLLLHVWLPQARTPHGTSSQPVFISGALSSCNKHEQDAPNRDIRA